MVERIVIALLANGNILLEGLSGLAKTRAIKSLSKNLAPDFSRIQFTPDLLPGDVTGVSVYNPVDREFEFKPGAIFAQIVIADEINRSSPKTQSALLEAMEERQVTADGTSHQLADPFLVVATQNPLEMEGTYALPEAQRDRFMMRISMGYPDAASEAVMLRQRDTRNPLEQLTPVVGAAQVRDLIAWARSVHVSPAVEEYSVALARATREHPDLRLGASPRATLQLVRAAKVWAALDGREFVIPDDVATLVEPVFAHRIIAARTSPTARTRSAADTISAILRSIVGAVRVPLATR